MIDQLIIGEKASFDDFGASLAKRNIKPPKKKSIKETVPHSNVTYDFSAINGEVYWEERELEYIFEMIASTPERLEEMKIAFSNWIMNVIEQNIFDPFLPDYHFVGTYEDMNFSDDDGMDKTTVTVVFLAYPYKIANLPKKYSKSIAAGATVTLNIENESSHRITPTIETDQSITIQLNGANYALSAGKYTDETLKISAGRNALTIQNTGAAACTVSVRYHEEVF